MVRDIGGTSASRKVGGPQRNPNRQSQSSFLFAKAEADVTDFCDARDGVLKQSHAISRHATLSQKKPRLSRIKY